MGWLNDAETLTPKPEETLKHVCQQIGVEWDPNVSWKTVNSWLKTAVSMGVSALPFVSGAQIHGHLLFAPCNEEENYSVARIETTENYLFKNDD